MGHGFQLSCLFIRKHSSTALISFHKHLSLLYDVIDSSAKRLVGVGVLELQNRTKKKQYDLSMPVKNLQQPYHFIAGFIPCFTTQLYKIAVDEARIT